MTQGYKERQTSRCRDTRVARQLAIQCDYQHYEREVLNGTLAVVVKKDAVELTTNKNSDIFVLRINCKLILCLIIMMAGLMGLVTGLRAPSSDSYSDI
jgi:hypothetical protein